MPKFIRHYMTQIAIGFGLGAVFVAMLLYFNIANLWHLVSQSEDGWLAVLILWFANSMIFAGVQFALAAIGVNDDDDDGPGGGLRQPIPVRVHVRSDERRF
jgi:hypothetical protein